ncbi:MAG: L,D-transpeptidase family protein [Parcubacteria group bacterium]|nr:L,D-transpeptidase family protein [Parcubacteria group bacterium]
MTLRTPIPLYIVILILTLLTGGIFFYAWYSQNDRELYRLPFDTRPAGGNHTDLNFGSWPDLGNADFFQNVHKKFIDNRTTFIEANLSAMQITFYENGVQKLQVPILAKGREGSWWETPAGLYKVELKKKNHFSGFGKVYQPWSMVFQGNFFIHGWPYYPDGTPVASSYSGGCIRLSTGDAEQIYNLASVGTPVLVFEKSFENDQFSYHKEPPQLSASHYLAVDLDNNFVFTEHLPKEVIPIASITKLITALVATEYINIEKVMTVPKQSLVYTSKPRLKTGEHISLFQLLYPLLLESSNEAALTISSSLGNSYFTSLMDQKAKAIGMEHAHFVDAAGISKDNTASAEDLFNLAKYLYHNRSFILKFTTGKLRSATYGAPIFDDLQNFNLFSDDPEFVGGKVGKTESAGETMLAVFEMPKGDKKRPIAIIILDSKDNATDVRTLYDWIKNNY